MDSENKKERPLTEMTVDKVLENTGTEERPFYAMVSKIRRFRVFGFLLYKFGSKSKFPKSYTGKPELE